MSSSVISVEWLNQNSLRNYPFREDCGLRPNDSAGILISDGWRLPNYLVTDFVLGVNGSGYDHTVYLKRMSVVNSSVTLTFADSSGHDAFTVASVSGESVKEIAGVGNFKDSKGVIRFGDLSRFFDETPDGIYSFSKEETLIEPTCIRPSAKCIRSISVVDPSGYTTAGLQGDIKLVAGENVNIKYLPSYNAVIISADPNSGYTDGCDCEDDSDNHVVRSINGVRTEDVTIVGDDCVTVHTSGGIITISDSCSKPCCGCAETAFINQTINDLQSSVNTLTSNVDRLSDRVTTFVNNYLLARKTLV